MPRKSQEHRTQQTLDLIAAYNSAGILDSRQGRFIQDVAGKMQRGKYPTKRQREWLDSLIETGVPESKGDPALLARINEAREVWAGNPNRAYQLNVVDDFHGRLRGGRELSVKQNTYLTSLLEKAQKDMAGIKWVPTEDQKTGLEIAVKLYTGYSEYWKRDRPAVYTCVERVREWLAGVEHAEIEEYHYNKLMKAVAGRIKKFKNPRFKLGDMAYYYMSDLGTLLDGRRIVTAVTDVYINDRGAIINDWLHDGNVVAIDQDRIAKR